MKYRIDYRSTSLASFSDYYPFGMQMPGRHMTNATGYRYGFQGQEVDDEIKGEGNSVNYKYRMHDPRIGRFFAIDPLTSKYPYYSPYSFSGNRVIDMIELEGLEPAETGLNFSMKVNLSNFKGKSGSSLSFSAGGYIKKGGLQWGSNYSLTLSSNELGTSGFGKNIVFGSISQSLTLGSGSGNPLPLQTFNGLSSTSISNSYKYSFTIAQNFVLSSGSSTTRNRNQRLGYLGFKLGDFAFGTSNDTKNTLGDGRDEFWSAGISLQYGLGEGRVLSSIFDMYYGNSDHKGTNNNTDIAIDDKRKNQPKIMKYDNQNLKDMSFNNAANYLQLTIPQNGINYNLGVGIQGRSAMWPSNTIHNMQDFHHLYVPDVTRFYLNGGLGQ